MDENVETKQAPKNEEERRPSSKPARFKKRVCRLCQEKVNTIDYKKTDVLVRFVSNKGKILPRRLSGSCAKHQRVVASAIKRARASGFMPYSAR